ncbi:MAG TPA: hypothetical protein VFJ82_08185 [Longimicrobium sp.]|nr:hypothetical protein [Longimicrobium sp.]
MASKTISAYTDAETASMVEQLSRVEQRKPSQIAAAALAFYVRLPAEAHAALRRLEAMGTPEDLNLMRREVTRAISNASYNAAVRQSGPRVREQFGDALDSDDDILSTAVLFSGSPQRSPGVLRVAEPGPAPREPGTEPGEP